MVFRFFLYAAIAGVFLRIVLSDDDSMKLQVVQVQKVDESNFCPLPGPFDFPPDKETLRMVTKEELEFHDGNQTDTLWLSIMSKVFDVTAGPEYYAPDAPYRVFVGRDANVPFITGVFNPDEAEKPLTELENHQLFALEHWSQFYDDEEKYPFIGLLVGELYDKDGNPTESMKKVREKIAEAKVQAEERKKKTAEIIAKRKKEAAEKKNMKKV
jgi:Cytochrome b5-like Heme/Steroid binding domain